MDQELRDSKEGYLKRKSQDMSSPIIDIQSELDTPKSSVGGKKQYIDVTHFFYKAEEKLD
jgi:hypothetical protein